MTSGIQINQEDRVLKAFAWLFAITQTNIRVEVILFAGLDLL
jgi:hypothetical protein